MGPLLLIGVRLFAFTTPPKEGRERKRGRDEREKLPRRTGNKWSGRENKMRVREKKKDPSDDAGDQLRKRDERGGQEVRVGA